MLSEEIRKWFVLPNNAPAFEIPATNREEAEAYVKKNFRGCGEVRYSESIYRVVCSTPYIART